MNNKNTILAIVSVIILVVLVAVVRYSPGTTTLPIDEPVTLLPTTILYTNTDFGFTFTLPDTWTGYSVVQNSWQGNPLTLSTTKQSGPKLLIRNPRWTTVVPYQDIPLLVFTLDQWRSYTAGDFAISAAPIEATELGRNNRYVFALPPRWGFDYSEGYEEAQRIVQSHPLHTESMIVLRENGLAVVKFGTKTEEAVAILKTILGEPTRDTGIVDSFSAYGTCPGDKMRGLEWGPLHVFFGDSVHGKGAMFGYEYVDRINQEKPVLKTEKGITLGATKEAIKGVYPDASFGEWLPGQTGTTFVRGGSGTGIYLGGTIEDGKLFWIGGGVLCGE